MRAKARVADLTLAFCMLFAAFESAANCLQPRQAFVDSVALFRVKLPQVPNHVIQYLDGEESRAIEKSRLLEAAGQLAFKRLYEHEFYNAWRVRTLLERVTYNLPDLLPNTATPTLQQISLALIRSHAALVNASDLRHETEEMLIRTPQRNEDTIRAAVSAVRSRLLDYSNCMANYIVPASSASAGQ